MLRMRDFLAATRERVVVFDGGMGATLEMFDLGLERDYRLPGRCHEALVLNRPDVIEGVHARCSTPARGARDRHVPGVAAEARRVGPRPTTRSRSTSRRAEIARKAAGENRFVAGSIGPTGFLPASDDPSLGQIRFGELVEVFTEQATGLVKGGVDLIIIETAQDILEVKAAIFGAREAFKASGRTLPIQCSVSLLPNGGKMLLGTDISAVLTTLDALRVDVIGLNCSTGPEDMRDAIRFLGENSPVPVHCIPNAGLPLQGPERRDDLPRAARAAGGRARRVRRPLRRRDRRRLLRHDARPHRRDRRARRRPGPAPRPSAGPPHVSTMIAATSLVQAPRPTLVGERVNSQGSRKAKELLLADDYDGLVTVAEDQVEGGAHVLDICVALTERQDEAEQMRQVVKRICLTQPAPIQIDSTEPDVIETALEQIPGRAIVNSINLEAGRDKLDRVVPLARKPTAPR